MRTNEELKMYRKALHDAHKICFDIMDAVYETYPDYEVFAIPKKRKHDGYTTILIDVTEIENSEIKNFILDVVNTQFSDVLALAYNGITSIMFTFTSVKGV